MNSRAVFAVLLGGCLFAQLSRGQECEVLRGGTVAEATEYLRHAVDESAAASCVKAAFHRIGASPPEQAIPLLIGYLAYKRPLSEGERRGIFMHGGGPSELYPAVHELYLLGSPAEPALVGLIAGNRDSAAPEEKNALYTMLLIHHGDVVSVIKLLHKEGISSTNEEARDRLQAAARDALKWCDERSRAECEEALK